MSIDRAFGSPIYERLRALVQQRIRSGLRPHAYPGQPTGAVETDEKMAMDWQAQANLKQRTANLAQISRARWARF
jgi:YD repeat-containing protein